jgi:dolichol-phosphate mannosyltransferase
MENTISLIIPALNEESVVGNVLEDIYQVANTCLTSFELILIDDGSTDKTGEIMKHFAFDRQNVKVIVNDRNRGLGASFQRGLGESVNNYVMLLCGDGGLPAKSLPIIFAEVGKTDLVIPYMSNLKKIKSKKRYILSRTYVFLLNSLFGFNLRYYNGLPVYRRDLLSHISITSSGFGFQGEILVKLLKSKCSYVEVGVLGAEETGKSDALRLKNIASVARTFFHLCFEIIKFKPIPIDVIDKKS